MEMFNVHRRDVFNFDDYMDLKKPGFGGPSSAKEYRDGRGNIANPKPKLKDYQRVVERDPLFSHPHYNSTYKAMTHDVVYKQAKKKPFTYKDPYITALPVVQVGAMQEGLACSSFTSFLNEAEMQSSMEGGRMFKLRGVTARDAMAMAEDILLDERIEYDAIDNAPEGIQGRGFKNKNGELIAYVDVERRELVVLPAATQMSDREYQRIQDPNAGYSQEPEMDDDNAYDELEDRDREYYEEGEDDAAEIDDVDDIESMKDEEDTTSDVEALLRSFEEGEDEDEEI